MAMSLEKLAQLLEAMGCPASKSAEMAAQLDRRARQLSQQRDRPYEDALAHLLDLLRQGWAAKDRGL
jgi:CxxC motif-containing protein (DUF1111 family)